MSTKFGVALFDAARIRTISVIAFCSCFALFMVSSPDAVKADDQLPIEWNALDIGATSIVGGSSSTADDIITNNGGAPGLGALRDAFHFVYQSYTGDFTLTVHIHFADSASPGSQAGIIARQELCDNSNYAAALVSPDHAAFFDNRTDFSPTAELNVSGSANLEVTWLRLIRQGGYVRAYEAGGEGSSPGDWRSIGQPSKLDTGMIFVGLFVASGDASKLCSTQFDHISLISGTPPVEDGAYTIHPISNSALVLDGSSGAGAPMAIALPSPAAKQTWIIKKTDGNYCSIKLAGNPTLALTVANDSSKAGTKVILASYTGADTQLWSLVTNQDSSINIYSKHNLNTGLDDLGGSANPGESIDIWSNIDNDPHQQWTLEPASPQN